MPKIQRYAGPVPKRSVSDELLRDIGQRLLWLRQAFGHSQAELARALQIPVQQLNKWEAGTRLPNLDALATIVTHYRASFDYLILGRLTLEMNFELRARLFEQHATELTQSAPPPSVPPSPPRSPPKPRRRKKSGDKSSGHPDVRGT